MCSKIQEKFIVRELEILTYSLMLCIYNPFFDWNDKKKFHFLVLQLVLQSNQKSMKVESLLMILLT